MSNLHAKIFTYHFFKGKFVGQLLNGYINASALCSNLEQLFTYAVASKGDSYIRLVADELGLSPRDLIIVYRNDYWVHPKIAPHFAIFLGDDYLFFVLGCLHSWASVTHPRVLPFASADVCEFLRRCYRLSCEELI